MRINRYISSLLIAVVALLTLSCGATRHLGKDEYLLSKVHIREDKATTAEDKINHDNLKKYIRQMPNKKFLGTNFYVWVYNLANPNKDNGWNNFKRKIGQAPVILSQSETARTLTNLKIYLDTRGFFSSSVDCTIDTLKKKKVALTYNLHQGEPFRIGTIEYDFKDRFIEPIILADSAKTLLKSGNIFDLTILDAERERITTALKDRGYYNFTVRNIEYIADTITSTRKANIKMVVKQNMVGYDNRGSAIYDNNAVYRLRNINIIPLTNNSYSRQNSLTALDTISYRGVNVLYSGKRTIIRPRVLRANTTLYPNTIYDYSQVLHTYNSLMQLGYIKSARIGFSEINDSIGGPSYITYAGKVGDKHKYITTEKAIDCNIYYTPHKHHSIKAELEGSTTSSFYGLKATVGYQNRNLFKGAESFDILGTVGYEYMKAKGASKHNAIEFGLSTSLALPRFLFFHVSPLSSYNNPTTKFEISYNYQNRPYYRRNLSSFIWSYGWKDNKYSSFVVRPLGINWVDVSYIDQNYFNSLQNEYLKHSYESQLIFAISGSYIYNNTGRNLRGNATKVRFNIEGAGNLVDGLEHLFSHKEHGKDYYSILGIRFSQYIRADIDISRKIMFGKVTSLAGHFFAGVGYAYGNSQAIPFDRMFYAGGSNSMRGWTPRTLGPGASAMPQNVVYPTQMGDMKLEANIEFRFPIIGIFQGAAFLDAGNVWYVGRDNMEYPEGSVFNFGQFYKQLAFDGGIGLRLDIKFAILRLDWGIQLHNPNRPEGERWISKLKWKDSALNFGVGFPF